MKAKGENKEESNRDEEYFQRVILALSNISNAPCYDFDSLKADTLLEKIDERQIGCMFEEYLQKHFFEKDLSFIAVALNCYENMMNVNLSDYEDLMDAMNLVDQIKKVSELGKKDSTKPEKSTESVQDCTHNLLSQTHLSSEWEISNSGKRESRLQLQQMISTATIRNANEIGNTTAAIGHPLSEHFTVKLHVLQEAKLVSVVDKRRTYWYNKVANVRLHHIFA